MRISNPTTKWLLNDYTSTLCLHGLSTSLMVERMGIEIDLDYNLFIYLQKLTVAPVFLPKTNDYCIYTYSLSLLVSEMQSVTEDRRILYIDCDSKRATANHVPI
jgi:cellobiose-specific phosphotransferase system component IIB